MKPSKQFALFFNPSLPNKLRAQKTHKTLLLYRLSWFFPHVAQQGYRVYLKSSDAVCYIAKPGADWRAYTETLKVVEQHKALQPVLEAAFNLTRIPPPSIFYDCGEKPIASRNKEDGVLLFKHRA